MRFLLLGVIAVGFCGPSKEKVEAERAALSVAIDQSIAAIRASHACDSEREAYLAALRASTDAIRMSRAAYEIAQAEEDRAEAKKKMCESLTPTVQESSKKGSSAWDEWMDACLECATGRACVDAERKRREIWKDYKTPPAQEIAALEEARKSPVCTHR